ncbi:MAG: peptidoglycan D,D-transpeptidase FtsI family protein [Parcubacteria group bacterium]
MWKQKKNNQKKEYKKYNNRLYFVVAVIFLLLSTLVIQLYTVQIKNHDYYSAMASGQHNISADLTPSRGSIYMTDSANEKVFTIATNKDFASLFFIPKEAINKEKLAEKVYLALYHEEIQEEAKKLIKEKEKEDLESEISYINSLDISNGEKQEKINSTKAHFENRVDNQDFKERKDIAISLEIEKEKEEIIDSFLKKLRKFNDPYEPIASKLTEDQIFKLYRYLASTSDEPLAEGLLSIRNFKVYLKDTNYNNLDLDLEIKEDGQIIYPGISQQTEKYRYYPEKNITSQLTGFVRQDQNRQIGNYGLEEFFDKELYGSLGSVSGQKSSGNTVMISNRQYFKAEDGADLVLTIDRPVQFRVCQELEQAVDDYQADGGTVIVLEPKTGAIIAMCSYPNFDANDYSDVKNISLFNNPAVFEQFEPGSTFKTMTMAIALDGGKVSPDTSYQDEGKIMIEGWHKPIKNSDYSSHGPHGWVNMNTVLAKSLNTGAIYAMKQVGADNFSDYLKDFGFGQKTGIELGSEAKGNMNNLLNNNIREIDAATTSFGQGISVSPLQLIMAYGVIANDGVLMKPYLVKEIRFNDEVVETTQPRVIRRVISQKSASLVSGMLVNVIESGHATKAAVDGYYIGGKTGTAQVAEKGAYSADNYVHNFVGILPIDNPKFVVLTKLNNPKTVKYSADSAAPLFGKISDFLLKYYKVPQER